MNNFQIFFFVFFILQNCFAEDNTKTRAFSIKPGSSSSSSISLDDVTCNFDFATNGGSSESWEISIMREGSEVICTIQRPNPPSYLQFFKFSASIVGAEIVESSIQDNLGQFLSENTFWEKSKHQVRPTSKWEGSLAILTIKGEIKKSHSEL